MTWHEARIARLDALTTITYPEELPIVQNLAKIRDCFTKHQVIIIAGDTGSGKTTQLPKLCLELGRGRAGRIGHTQPRRIAARAVAERIAQELQTPLGDVVGYKTRFREHLNPHTALKVMTDGILLAEMQQDKYLRQYDTLIIDEAHERSVNIDFILGCIKKILPKRPNLKLIVTSATLDLQRFSDYFNKAPIIEVEGRSYPIEMHYKSLESLELVSDDNNQLIMTVDTIKELLAERGGDILVFLPTERIIHELTRMLRDELNFAEIVPLYSRLSAKDQHKVFSPSNKLRVVLSTNVAETSLTVPGIRYVVDLGTARVSRYSQRMKVQRLPIERISKASAMQRAGRCGRVGPGKCIRLYGREDFESRDEFTLPEILRTNLAQIILRMTALRLGKIEEFPFIQPPNPRYINDGYQLLIELGALDSQRHLTALGEKMAKLTIDPRLSRLLISGSEKGCLAEIIIIASFLEAQDPRIRPKERAGAADQVHAQHADKRSDFMGILNLWNWLITQRAELSKTKFAQFCEKNFISVIRFNEWHEVHSQLLEEASHIHLRMNQNPTDYMTLHRALLTAFFTQIACKQEKTDYLGARGNQIKLFPGSHVYKTKPNWIVAGLLLETEQLYAHLVAAVEPEWIIKAAGHFVKHHYADPHWEKSSQRVTALRRTSLLGLILEDKKRVNYEHIDPVLAREIFIRGAMVQGDWLKPLDFFVKNQKLLEEVSILEEQSRRRDIVIDEESLYEFYAEQIPAEINELKKLEKWYREAEFEQKQKLLLNKEDVIRGLVEDVTKEKFPGHIVFESCSWPVTYNFAPGTKDDGITVRIKVEALLRNLPKQMRKQIMPLQNVAQRFVKEVKPSNQPLLAELSRFLNEHYRLSSNVSEWPLEDLSQHFFVYYRIMDKNGKECAASRDYDALMVQFSSQAKLFQEKMTKDALPQFEKMIAWQCGGLPEKITIQENGVLNFFPALKDNGENVSVVYLDDEEEARFTHRKGVLRLLFIALRQEINYLRKSLTNLKNSQIKFSTIGSPDSLVEDLLFASLDRCFLQYGEIANSLPHSKESFEEIIVQHKKNLVSVTQKVCEQLNEIMQLFSQVKKHFPGSSFLKETFADIQQQLNQLVYPGFILLTPHRYWPRLINYLRGILIRLEKSSNNPTYEKNTFSQLQPLIAKYEKLRQNNASLRKLTPTQKDALENYHWMLEEYRLSLFSQPIKTLFKVSAKRLDEEWRRVII